MNDETTVIKQKSRNQNKNRSVFSSPIVGSTRTLLNLNRTFYTLRNPTHCTASNFTFTFNTITLTWCCSVVLKLEFINKQIN